MGKAIINVYPRTRSIQANVTPQNLDPLSIDKKIWIHMKMLCIGLMMLVCAGCGDEVAKAPIGVQLWENGPFWAECNVGATKPEEYGYYFWWGFIDGRKWEDPSPSGQYADRSKWPRAYKSRADLIKLGYLDSSGNLVSSCDAATAHLGFPWRMPTIKEFNELIRNCTTKWTKLNGVNGRIVSGKGKFASKSIFLPAAGIEYEPLATPGYFGGYWSSTAWPRDQEDSDDEHPPYLFIDSSRASANHGYFGRSYYGRSIRALRDPTN